MTNVLKFLSQVAVCVRTPNQYSNSTIVLATYIPFAFKWFDMQDVSCLIAPRKLTLLAGKKDPSFLIEGVRKGYQTIKNIYREEGTEENCNFIETELGHVYSIFSAKNQSEFGKKP